MKRNLLIGLIAMIIGLGCKKTEIATYDGEQGVYFSVRYENPRYTNSSSANWANQPYTITSFLNTTEPTITIKLRVNITGNSVGYDRAFKVVVDKDSTTAVEGQHYEPIKQEYVVKANEFYGEIPVVIKRTSDLRTKEVKLGLRLLENESFKLTMPVWYPIPTMQENVIGNAKFDARYHAIRFSDLLVQPPVWAWYGAVFSGSEDSYWGAFTPGKYDLMCRLSGLTYSDFTPEKMGVDRALTVANTLSRYLREQMAKGTPVIEPTDGRLMWVYGVTWTSTLGVPYKP